MEIATWILCNHFVKYGTKPLLWKQLLYPITDQCPLFRTSVRFETLRTPRIAKKWSDEGNIERNRPIIESRGKF
ncbi:MAG: hypothetical protein A2Z90_14535 [Burkholderiales bacterium GWA2_64_37]|nr:MAG: hypothetical protein A2Z90_14535 [Burkholderiales bacterium GWA2_64_37]